MVEKHLNTKIAPVRSRGGLLVRAIQSPKCIICCAVDCTYLSRFISEIVEEHLGYSFEIPTFYQNDISMINTAKEAGGKPFDV
jgi:hypothetical protein